MRLVVCLIGLVLLAGACNDKGAKVAITNQRDTALRNVVVTNGSHSFSIPSIPPGKTREASLSFKDMPLVDGAYGLRIDNRKDSFNFFIFGYYSNGSPSERVMNVLVYNDSLGFKFDHQYN